ncbi:hypothetical protein HJFPF1_09209 [Paramyrothecium foliicola]|nr:hypothetical protein HJFPF1_09209 [Paramyrothecium foliicola]
MLLTSGQTSLPYPGMSELPQIILDTTLADLYRRASPRYTNKRIAQVLCGVNAAFNLTPNVPRNTKYLYQDGSFNSVAKRSSAMAEAQHRRQLAMKYLSLIPQRDAFICGDTDVILFHLGETPQTVAHDKSEAETTLQVLDEKQRPNLVFCSGPAQIPVKQFGIDLIAHKIMLDGLEDYDLVAHPETHWFLNSKVALARSGLPTPHCEIIEFVGHIEEVAQCCAMCQEDPTAFPVPSNCAGVRGKWLDQQSLLVYDAISKHPLPFVLKNQQTFGGAGTYMIRTEADRRQVLDDFRGGVLRKLLSSVTSANHHLNPGALLLSDMIEEPIGDYGLTFFVTENGHEPIFLAASEQMTDGNGAWIGSTINYSHQIELKKKFGPLVQKISEWLQSYGYIGPAGADVLESRTRIGSATGNSTRTNGVEANGSQPNGQKLVTDHDMANYHIVDLNIRTSGSLCLPLLRNHFTSRGLNSASSSSISTKMDRMTFVHRFQEDFASGKMCILSWFEDAVNGMSLADIAIGAENDGRLTNAMKVVEEMTDSITF